MPKPTDPLRFPPHYETMLREVSEAQAPMMLEFSNEGEAKSFRFDWYAWVKAHKLAGTQASNELVELARPVVLSFRAPSTIIFSNRLTSRFAQAFESQGIMPAPPRFEMPTELVPTPTSFNDNPMRAFEDAMSKLGYVAGKKPGDHK